MTDEEDMSSLTANDQSNLTAPVLLESHTESEEGLPEVLLESHTESEEGLPGVICEKEKRAAKVSSKAPHRMVHWQSHLDFLKNNFDTCMECKDPGAILEESDLTGISTTLKINCKTCDKAHDKAYNRYMYLKRKDEGEKEEAKKESNNSKERDRKTYFNLEYARKKLSKLREKRFNRISRPKFSKHISAREKRN